MDVTAKNSIDLKVARIAHDSLLKLADKADDILDFSLYIAAKRPVTEPEAAPKEIDRTVAAQEQSISDVSKMCKPAEILDNRVQFISMHHKQPAAVRSEVNGVPLERHAPVVALKAVQETRRGFR